MIINILKRYIFVKKQAIIFRNINFKKPIINLFGDDIQFDIL